MNFDVLHIDSEIDAKPGMGRLLADAATVIHVEPGLAERLYDGTYRIECPVPPGYKLSMNRFAKRLTARMSEQGYIFEISEADQNSSGGWIGSCIPPTMFKVFLTAWLAHVNQPRQRELFI